LGGDCLDNCNFQRKAYRWSTSPIDMANAQQSKQFPTLLGRASSSSSLRRLPPLEASKDSVALRRHRSTSASAVGVRASLPGHTQDVRPRRLHTTWRHCGK
jgi:hypothetical protein